MPESTFEIKPQHCLPGALVAAPGEVLGTGGCSESCTPLLVLGEMFWMHPGSSSIQGGESNAMDRAEGWRVDPSPAAKKELEQKSIKEKQTKKP